MEWLMAILGIIPIIIVVVAVVYALCNRDQFKADKSVAKAYLYEKIQFACVCWWLVASTITETAMEMQRIASTSNWSIIGTKLIWVVPVWLMATAFFKGEKYKNEKAVRFSYLMAIGYGLVVVAEAIYSVIVYFVA